MFQVLGEFPDAGLNLVEREDGRWFVEVDHGSLFDHLPGVSRPQVAPRADPSFFDSQARAATFALACIRQTHPSLSEEELKALHQLASGVMR